MCGAEWNEKTIKELPRKESRMFIWWIVKWVFRRITGRAIRGLRGKALSGVATSLLGRDGTGLTGLLERFNQGGLGQLVQSWVGKGANQQLSAEQAKSILGADAIAEIAGQLGTSEEAASSKVAGILPQLIDKLTPDGELPAQETLSKRLADLLKQ
jgi:uncharacterized protein YidB (DUF937 family)